MAANYGVSTQKKSWFFTSDKLAEIREETDKQNAQLLEQFPYPDRRLMFIFLKDRLLQLAKRLQFRQQCVATALVYMHRYFLTTPMQSVNLYLLAATAIYLASKTEESPQHIRLVASEGRQAWPEYVSGDVARLGEMEFCLISEMRSQLIVWHPYRSLLAMKDNQELKLTNDELGLAWSIINDSFLTDLPLTCSPHLMALIAMFLAVVFLPVAKANGNIRSLPSGTPPNSDSSAFSSLKGGRTNMSNIFGTALHNLPLSSSGSSMGTKMNGNHARSTGGDPNASFNEKEQNLVASKHSEKLQNTMRFLVEAEVDLEMMVEKIQELISLYEVWESYNEKTVKEAIAKCLKTQHLDN